MTTFITGGTSSIGRVLIKTLAQQGEPLRVLVRPTSDRRGINLPNVTFVMGDVSDEGAVRRGMAGCERVCHLAAVVGQRVAESEWWRVNRDGTRTVLQAACDVGVQSVVQVSSLAVLGPTEPGEIADESRPVDTGRYFNLYQKTKRAADDIGRDFAGRGLRVVIVYPGFGYGCSWASSHPSLAETTLLRLAAGKPVAILGSGENRLCVAYYKDTVQGILLAHERGRAGDDYILGGENLTFPEIWAVVAGVLGQQPPRLRVPLWALETVARLGQTVRGRSPFPPEFFEMIRYHWVFSTAKAQRELGWQPHPFAAGMAETWAEYQAQGWGKAA